MTTDQDRSTRQRFVRALHHDPLMCMKPGCGGPMEITDITPTDKARTKTYVGECTRCRSRETLAGQESLSPPWDEGALTIMAEAHLLHAQPICPFDDTPVEFVSMTNPRRKARYRLCCYFCGRQAEMDWPPPEAKR